MKRNFLSMLLFSLFLSYTGTAMAQSDWATINPDLALPSSGTVYSSVAAMTNDPQGIPYAFAVTTDNGTSNPTYRYYVVKYTSGGWTQLGADLPMTLSSFGEGSKIRVASDGTVYLLCGDNSIAHTLKIFRLLPNASEWQELGSDFTAGSSGYSTLELDANGIPYIEIIPPSGKLLIEKYVTGNWLVLNGTATAPLQPSVPAGYSAYFKTSPIAVANDGTVYTLVYSLNWDTFDSAEELQSLSPDGQWQSHGTLPIAFVLVKGTQTLFSLNRSTGWLYMYGKSNGFVGETFDGSNITITTEFNPTGTNNYSKWYASSDGTAYVIYDGTGGLIHLEKFSGSDLEEVGTPFAISSNLSSEVFTGNPNHLYLGFTNANTQLATVSQLQIGKSPQTITFPAIPGKTYGDADFDLSATASSNLTVTYAIADPSVATVTNGTVHILKGGTTTITASQAGNDTYAAATDVTVNLTVSKATQTISGLSDLAKTFGDANFDLSATATSGLAVSYSSSNTAVATISGNTVHIAGAGTATITASQTGDNKYLPATNVTISLTVNKSTQTISGLSDISKTVSDANFDLSATATSGLPVSYSSSNMAVATISGSTVHIAGAGTSIITASQAGDNNYEAAPNITVNLVVTNPAGLWDVRNNTSLSIAGNPVQGSEAHLTFTGAGQGAVLHVTDLTGKTLIQQNLVQGVTTAVISVDKLSKGVYLVNYSDNNGKRATVKMIK